MGKKYKDEKDFDNYEEYEIYRSELLMKTSNKNSNYEKEKKEFHYHNPYFEKETEFKKKFILANYIISDLLFK